MKHYPHHIGDFDKATRHLTRIERSVYRDLIDLYYSTEKRLTLDLMALCRKIVARSDEESTAVEQVLNEFFEHTETGWYHDRCEVEILAYMANTSQKAMAGKASAEAKRLKKQHDLAKTSTAVERPLNSVETREQRNSTNQSTINQSTNQPEEIHVAQSARRDQVASVFNHWRQVMKHPRSAMDAKRRKLIESRMKEGYSEEDLKSAIDGCSRSSFHMGGNDRQQRYDGLDLILRDASHVDNFLSLERNPPVIIPPVKVAPRSESFRERDERLARERYAEMVGRPVVNGQHNDVIDITPTTLEIDHASDQSR